MKFCPNCGNRVFENANYCKSCGKKISHEKINATENMEAKRNIVSSGKRVKSSRLFFNIALFVIFSGSIFYYFFTDKTKEQLIIDEQPQVVKNLEYPNIRYDMSNVEYTVQGDNLVLSLDEVMDKKFIRFVYNNSQRKIPMLAYISEEGSLVTSISMCEPCNSTTFHIKGDKLVCNSCGSTWELNSLKEVSGSCGKYPPDPLPSKVVGNKIMISIENIENWQRRI